MTTGQTSVLVTGATDGIGQLLAQRYAWAGARVLATGRKPRRREAPFFLEEQITYLHADQADPQRAATLIAEACRSMGWQGIDRAILNAGLGWSGNALEEPVSSINAQVDVNLAAPVMIAAEIAPLLFAAEGQLTLIGSIAHRAAPRFATYSATKAGLNGFARSLASEWQGRAEVQIIHPGAMRTAMHEKAGFQAVAFRRVFASPDRAANALFKAIEKGRPQVELKARTLWLRGGPRGRELRP